MTLFSRFLTFKKVKGSKSNHTSLAKDILMKKVSTPLALNIYLFFIHFDKHSIFYLKQLALMDVNTHFKLN